MEESNKRVGDIAVDGDKQVLGVADGTGNTADGDRESQSQQQYFG